MIALPKRMKLPSGIINSRRHERGTAKRLRAEQTKASGQQIEKGDVRIKGLLRVECKSTIHKSFSVTPDIIQKIENAATGAGEIPVIEILLGTGQRVCVIPTWALDMLVDKAR